jgi:hypothetical protein
VLLEIRRLHPEMTPTEVFKMYHEWMPDKTSFELCSTAMKDNKKIDAVCFAEDIYRAHPSFTASEFRRIICCLFPDLSAADFVKAIRKCAPNATFGMVREQLLSYIPTLTPVEVCKCFIGSVFRYCDAFEEIRRLYPEMTLSETFRIYHDWLPELGCRDLWESIRDKYPSLGSLDAIGELIGTTFGLEDVLRATKDIGPVLALDIPKTLELHLSADLAHQIRGWEWYVWLYQQWFSLFCTSAGDNGYWMEARINYRLFRVSEHAPSLVLCLDEEVVVTGFSIQITVPNLYDDPDPIFTAVQWRVEIADEVMAVDKSVTVDQFNWTPVICYNRQGTYVVVDGFRKGRWMRFTGIVEQGLTETLVRCQVAVSGFIEKQTRNFGHKRPNLMHTYYFGC